MAEIAIAGSGPSGVTVAHSLLKLGFEVTLFDPGMEIEKHLLEISQVSAGRDFNKDAFLNHVQSQRQVVAAKRDRLPAKLPFGSDFAYVSLPKFDFDLKSGARPVFSLAKGGLSNAWGANINSVNDTDLADWPFQEKELSPHFKALSEILDFSAEEDAIDEQYTTKLKSHEPYPLGNQGKMILDAVRLNQQRLISHGLYVGRSKIAIGKRYSYKNQGCVLCGQCMHGCSFQAIFNSAFVLSDLIAQYPDRFKYERGFAVESFEEHNSEVELKLMNIVTGEKVTRNFKRAFLGCGVLRTTAIVARSLGWCDHEFEIKDSQKYLFAFWTFKRVKKVMQEQTNTLAQLFLQTKNLHSTSKMVHAQLYGFNDLIVEPLKKLLGPLHSLAVTFAKPFLEHIMIGMVYLSSSDSGSLSLKINPDPESPRLGVVTGQKNKRSLSVFREFISLLRTCKSSLGGFPLPFLKETDPPGGSQHYGGSLPMKNHPNKYETDILGRPFGCKRVHVVDSSVFPSIPGTPTTFLVMANAHRIALNSSKL